MSDQQQELAVALEDLRRHLDIARRAAETLASLKEEMSFDPFEKVYGVTTDLMLASITVAELESEVVAYFSLRAGGRK